MTALTFFNDAAIVVGMKRRVAGTPMVRKGERTRQRIVREAADIFNVHGFAGTSVADVSLATGLEKGSVYNHFESKDALALAAFDYAAAIVLDRVRAAMHAQPRGVAQVRALLDLYGGVGEAPLVRGGCPILNTAVEADDTHPALRERTRATMDGWLELVTAALEDAISAGELRGETNAGAVAATLVGALEGGILLARLYGDAARLRAVTEQLSMFIDSLRTRSR